MNSTSKDAVKRFEQVISNAGGTLLGSVATGAAAAGLYGGYGYGYYGYRQDPPSNGSSPNGGASAKSRGFPGLGRWRIARRDTRGGEIAQPPAAQPPSAAPKPVHAESVAPNRTPHPAEPARPRRKGGLFS